NITYRIFDFNRTDANGKPRELHTELAKEAIDYELLDDYQTHYEVVKDEPVELVACPYFTTSLYDITENITCDYSELDSFVILLCMEGACTIIDNEGHEETMNAGETILLPASISEITIQLTSENAKLLETYV
ncbi:MAG: mannose-6-phosphate isomerase, partial [Bacteroidaceae bacterium]